MQFINTILLAATALASMASAAQNFVMFVNQDTTTTKHIVFTANAGLPPVDTLVLRPGETTTQNFPDSWIGNFYSYDQGSANVPGMLGEVRFNGYVGDTYYDISSIVNPDDNKGIKILYPFKDHATMKLSQLDKSPVVSGCETSGCKNQYNSPNEQKTLSTSDPGLVCLVGNLPSKRRRTGELFTRDYVTS